jgi:hypothetical protein
MRAFGRRGRRPAGGVPRTAGRLVPRSTRARTVVDGKVEVTGNTAPGISKAWSGFGPSEGASRSSAAGHSADGTSSPRPPGARAATTTRPRGAQLAQDGPLPLVGWCRRWARRRHASISGHHTSWQRLEASRSCAAGVPVTHHRDLPTEKQSQTRAIARGGARRGPANTPRSWSNAPAAARVSTYERNLTSTPSTGPRRAAARPGRRPGSGRPWASRDLRDDSQGAPGSTDGPCSPGSVTRSGPADLIDARTDGLDAASGAIGCPPRSWSSRHSVGCRRPPLAVPDAHGTVLARRRRDRTGGRAAM